MGTRLSPRTRRVRPVATIVFTLPSFWAPSAFFAAASTSSAFFRDSGLAGAAGACASAGRGCRNQQGTAAATGQREDALSHIEVHETPFQALLFVYRHQLYRSSNGFGPFLPPQPTPRAHGSLDVRVAAIVG